MALSSSVMSALEFLPGIVSGVTQGRTTKAEKEQQRMLERQRQYLEQQAQLIRDSADPNSDIYKQQLGIETGNVARDYAQSVEEIVRNQRRNANMGRGGLLDNERADEILSRLTNEGVVQANQRGREGARNSILNMANAAASAASSAGNMASGYGEMIEPQAERLRQRSSILSNLTQAGVDAIGSSQGRTIADIYRDMTGGKGGQNPANQKYNQGAQRAVPRTNQGGGWYA